MLNVIKPVDVVLVLDTSGSMDNEITNYTYTPAYNLNTNDNYYIESGDGYTKVQYCTRCKSWFDKSHWIVVVHDKKGTEYTPKTSENDTTAGRVTFYSRAVSSSAKKIDILKEAAANFVNYIGDTTNNPNAANNRVAIVQYNDNDYYDDDSYLTESTKSDYTSLCKNFTKTNDNGKTALINTINSLSASNATAVDYGLTIAETLFSETNDSTNEYSKDNDRLKFVVVFTDGVPTYGNSFDSDVANNAIDKAKTLKTDYDATVYSIGVFDETNTNINTYMNAMSSNYPKALSMTDLGEKNTTQKAEFYLTAQDAITLTADFATIAQEIGRPHYELTEETVVHDVITNYFDLDNIGKYEQVNLYKNIEVYKVACTAVDANGNATAWADRKDWIALPDSIDKNVKVTYDTTTKAVDVTGFDFSSDVNWVGKHPSTQGNIYGNKLVIEIPIELKDGYSGNLATNAPGSGVIPPDKTESVVNYPTPKVDIPATITIKPVKGSYAADSVCDFNVSYAKVTGFTDTTTDEGASWRKATTADATDSFSVAYGNTYSLENVYVGSKIKVSELNLPTGYTVTGKIGTNETVFTASCNDRYAEFNVSGDMTIEITNSTTATTYTVTYKDGVTGDTITTEAVEKDNKPVKAVSTDKTNYTFLGWYDSSDNKVTPVNVTITGNTTFTAKYEKTKYNVEYKYNGNTVTE